VTTPVYLDPRENVARPWLPLVALAGSTWVGPFGETVRVLPDGTVEPLIRGAAPWERSIASSPAPRAE
jgi:hypothetical protein